MSKKQNIINGRRRQKDHTNYAADDAPPPFIQESVRHAVKVGSLYAKRNSEQGERFVLTENEYKFNSPIMAKEARDYFEFRGKIAKIELVY